MNRLKLNFQLETNAERKTFVENYIKDPIFAITPLTPEELDTIANYLLWGKESDGQSPHQKKEIQLPSKWTNDPHTESLDALMEIPSFNEQVFRDTSIPQTRISQKPLSRSKELSRCPLLMRPQLENLFRQIDELELSINFYELAHNRRSIPPRDTLLARIPESTQVQLRADIASWTPYTLLRKKHQLIELRQSQYTLRDSYCQPMYRMNLDIEEVAPPPEFECEIEVFPLGLPPSQALRPGTFSVFQRKESLHPAALSNSDIEQAVRLLWTKRDTFSKLDKTLPFIDFRNREHVLNLLIMRADLQDAAATDRAAADYDSSTTELLQLLEYYIDFAEIDEIYMDILNLKIRKVRNQDIAAFVKEKYGKSYCPNYISTIFRQKILDRIVEAVQLHEKTVENLTFPENFKTCTKCGRTLLCCGDNFMVRSRNRDGYSARCKDCEKDDRNNRKRR